MNLKHGTFLLFAILHLSLIVLYNAHSIVSEHGYHLLMPYFQTATRSPFLRQYLIWSGTETVYGFFAPRVGSQHILLLQSDEITEKTANYPVFMSREGQFRYISFLDQLDDRLRSKDAFVQAYGRALLKGFISQYERSHKIKRTTGINLYVVIQPSLLNFATPIRYKKIYHLSLK